MTADLMLRVMTITQFLKAQFVLIFCTFSVGIIDHGTKRHTVTQPSTIKSTDFDQSPSKWCVGGHGGQLIVISDIPDHEQVTGYACG